MKLSDSINEHSGSDRIWAKKNNLKQSIVRPEIPATSFKIK